MDLFWVLIPLTIACGIYDLGAVETIAWVAAVFAAVFAGTFITLRLLGHIQTINPNEDVLYSFAKGTAWGAAMIFAWPTSWIGPVYLVILFLNLLLVTVGRPKKG